MNASGIADQAMAAIPTEPRVWNSRKTSHLLSALCLLASIGSWLYSLPQIDPRALDDYGLIFLLPWTIWVAFILLSIGFSLSLTPDLVRTPMPFLHITVLIALLHLTPVLCYETLRYAWAWKHLGIVDYIQRHGELDRTAPFLAAYHNWPGLFLSSAWISDLLGWRSLDLANVVRFAPPVLGLLYVLTLTLLYRCFTADWRLVWTAAWFFVFGNWIGQDYFSPQGVTYFLYLIVIALCVGPLRKPLPAKPHGFGPNALLDRFFRLADANRDMPPLQWNLAWRLSSVLIVLMLIPAMTATHQLTPVVLLVSLSALAFIGQLSLGYSVFAAVVLVSWMLFFANAFIASILPGLIGELGETAGAITERFVDTSIVSPGQVAVSWASRAITAAICLGALLGGLSRLAAGRVDGAPAVLVLAPICLLAMTSYGGEVLFRVYLFALPFLCFFAGALFFRRMRNKYSWQSAILSVTSILLSIAFVLANNGKDRQYVFHPAEVAAAAWLYENAPPGSTLVEGSTNYPYQFRNYENFFYVSISEEPKSSVEAILRDPAKELGKWLISVDPEKAFVIITRSQKAYTDDLGVLPKGALDRIETSLLASPGFAWFTRLPMRMFSW